MSWTFSCGIVRNAFHSFYGWAIVKKLPLIVLILCLFVSGRTTATEQQRLELAYSIIILSQTAEVMEDLMEVYMDQVIQTTFAENRVARITFKKLFIEEMEANRDALRWEFAEVYSRYYTESELSAVLNFMASPIGKRWLELQPLLSAEGEVIGEAWGQTLMENTLKRLESIVE